MNAPSQLKSFLKSALISVIFVYITLIAFLYIQQRSFIYVPDTNIPDKVNQDTADKMIDATVTTKDGLRITGWFFPPPSDSGPVILLFHGNAGNIGHRLHKALPYNEASYGVLLAEYRGYGNNPGKPTEQGLYNDARAYYAWLTKYGYKNIILYGESLGTGVAVQLATEIPARALILEAPYATLADPAQDHYPFIPFIELLMHDKYRSIDKVRTLKTPKLFLIAGKDEVLGPETGQRLFNAASEPKMIAVFETSAHNNLYDHGAAKTVLNFLSALAKQPANR